MAKFDRVGLDRCVVVCCSAFFSASMTIRRWEQQKTNRNTRSMSPVTDPMATASGPAEFSFAEEDRWSQDSAPAAQRCALRAHPMARDDLMIQSSSMYVLPRESIEVDDGVLEGAEIFAACGSNAGATAVST